jgi:LmbE family N-acetylglucosaminyl deacetylase
MTNGDASEYSMMYSEKDLVGSPGDYLALGRLRQRESQAGLGVLGVPPQRLYILGFPNGGLDKLWEPDNWLPANLWTSPRTRVSHNPYPGTWRPNAPYCGSQVLAELEGILGAVQPDVILAPMPLDVHPDHWATYDFVKLAVDQRPPSPGPLPRLYTYLVHLKDWPAPLGYHPGALLEPPAAFAHMARVQWWALPLSDQEVKQKISVLSMYRSQGPRWDHVLLALVRHDEIFAEVTPPDSGLPEVSLVDPIKDQPAERRRPGSDLALLAFRSQPASVGVSLSAAGPLEPGLTYAVLGHSPQATGPVAWELRARGKTATLTWVQDNMLHRQALPLIVQPGMLSVALPSALAEGHSLLVEAFSSTGRRYLDHTTTQTIVLGPGP